MPPQNIYIRLIKCSTIDSRTSDALACIKQELKNKAYVAKYLCESEKKNSLLKG